MGSEVTMSAISRSDGAANSLRPASNSQSTTPSANWSTSSVAGSPASCSGAM